MIMNTPGEQIMVAMSGGVDSAVSALILQRQGFPISAMFMKNWEEDDRFGECSAAEDVARCREHFRYPGCQTACPQFCRRVLGQCV